MRRLTLGIKGIKFDVLNDAQLHSIRISAQNLLDKITSSQKVRGGWNIRESIWPAIEIKNKSIKPHLILLPLSRIGVNKGFSGSEVMIGYFIDCSDQPIFPSSPMIVKIFKPSLRHDKLYDKLADEYKNALSIRPYVAYNNDCFALPIHFDLATQKQHYSVLWSPFSSSTWIWEAYQPSRLSLEVFELWKILELEKHSEDKSSLSRYNRDCQLILKAVFRLLMPLHKRDGTAFYVKRNIIEEYKSYLGEIDGAWGKRWKKIWSPGSTKYIIDFQRKWVNPFWIVEKLKSLPKIQLYCGAIHGDLHPRNIVLSDKRTPHLIDFAWASDYSHITKDFVLLECNFRFVYLKPEIQFSTLEALTKEVGFDTILPNIGNEYCNNRVNLINTLRDIAKNHFPPETNWDHEYIIPLFLVSLGLLRHLSSVENQIAARLFVLSLATYINQKVL